MHDGFSQKEAMSIAHTYRRKCWECSSMCMGPGDRPLGRESTDRLSSWVAQVTGHTRVMNNDSNPVNKNVLFSTFLPNLLAADNKLLKIFC